MKRWQSAVLVMMVLVWGQSVSAQETWKEHRARHFNIFYKKTPLDFVQQVEKAAEQYYDEITDNLGFMRYESWSYDKRAQIYIYDDQEDYVTSAKGAGWSHGSANARDKIIRTFPSAQGFFDTILPHELGHIIFREYIGIYTGVPLWFEEGVAMFQEKARRWGSNGRVVEAIANGRFINIQDLSRVPITHATDHETVDLYYTEAASIVYYLIVENGKSKFLMFCRNLRDGQPFEQSLASAYNNFDSLEELNKKWLQYLKSQ